MSCNCIVTCHFFYYVSLILFFSISVGGRLAFANNIAHDKCWNKLCYRIWFIYMVTLIFFNYGGSFFEKYVSISVIAFSLLCNLRYQVAYLLTPLSFFWSLFSHIHLVEFYPDFISPNFVRLLFGLILLLFGPFYFLSFSWWGLYHFKFIVSFWLCYLIIFAWIFSFFCYYINMIIFCCQYI
jgi:hypothetical protein